MRFAMIRRPSCRAVPNGVAAAAERRRAENRTERQYAEKSNQWILGDDPMTGAQASYLRTGVFRALRRRSD
jgi:hypothetical protein